LLCVSAADSAVVAGEGEVFRVSETHSFSRLIRMCFSWIKMLSAKTARFLML
jgi:hypothetical protein